MIPVLDLATAPPAALAARIDEALTDTGFFAVTGHGVPDTVVDGGFDAGRRFFALPEATKRRWHIDANHRGFDPIGWQALDPARPPDLKESFYLGVEAIAPNRWPDEALLPGFRAACEAYAAAMRALAGRLMGLFETALDLPAGHFDAFMRHPTCTTRLLHYPPQPVEGEGGAAPGQIGCGAHTDWGALTLLAQSEAGGLQVQHARGHWLDVPPLPGAFVVNIGDMTQRWTNDRWRSTVHRVVNRGRTPGRPKADQPPRGAGAAGGDQGVEVLGRERWSIAYFFDLDADADILPLPTCVSAQRPARYGPITAGEHLAAMYKKTTVSA